jgi:phosphopantothenoylcysteine decarboxylase/phosphopantothenate--cysteine ligase
VVVGFAAEHGAAGLQRARDKRTRKRLDVIVHNDISQPGIGFEGDQNAVTIIGPGAAETAVAQTSKAACAAAILDAVTPLLKQ